MLCDVWWCKIYHIVKTYGQNTSLYTPLSVAEAPWEDVSLDFVVELPRTQRNKYFVMVVVDRFLQMTHFVSCNKRLDASPMADFYFKEIVKLYRILKPLSSIRIQNI